MQTTKCVEEVQSVQPGRSAPQSARMGSHRPANFLTVFICWSCYSDSTLSLKVKVQDSLAVSCWWIQVKERKDMQRRCHQIFLHKQTEGWFMRKWTNTADQVGSVYNSALKTWHMWASVAFKNSWKDEPSLTKNHNWQELKWKVERMVGLSCSE